MSDLDQLAHLGLACSFCGAQPGEWCRTARPLKHEPGRRTTFLHDARTRLLWEAWKVGHTSGQAGVYGSLAQRLQARAEGAWWARETPTDLPGLAREFAREETRLRG